MELEDFRLQRVRGRQELLSKITQTFKNLQPIAIHQFGSGVNNYKDEFSDLDLWVTFADDRVDEIINTTDTLIGSVAKVLIKHEVPQNSPLEGKYILILFETDMGLFHVDLYISKFSKTVIRQEAIKLFGSDEIIRGEWVMDVNAKHNNSLNFEIDHMIILNFLAVKRIIRGLNDKFVDYVFETYENILQLTDTKTEPLAKKLDFQLIATLFKKIRPLSDSDQRKIIDRVSEFTEQVRKIYKISR